MDNTLSAIKTFAAAQHNAIQAFAEAQADAAQDQSNAWRDLAEAMAAPALPPPAEVSPPVVLPPEPEEAPFNSAAFFNSIRNSVFGGSLSQSQVDGINDIGAHCIAYKLSLTQSAYVFATAFHETAATMQPIAEYGKGSGKEYGQPAGPYDQCYYGRGYVQLTWHENYVKQDAKIKDKWGEDAQLEPVADNALDPKWAGHILCGGMLDGDFTGKGLPDYINDTKTDYVEARRIVNGTDKADMIAGYAYDFEAALIAGNET